MPDIYDEEPIQVNRMLARKPGIAGISADVFAVAIVMDVVLFFLRSMFELGWDVFVFAVIVVDMTWFILTIRGVYRFVGKFIKPPVYYRANIPYVPVLSNASYPVPQTFRSED
jgi:hypothetical protein